MYEKADYWRRSDGGGPERNSQREKEYQFNLSVLGDNPKLQYISHLDKNFLSHIDHLVFDDFEELIDINRFRKQGGDGQGCVRHEGGPLWALRGYTKGERLVLYQVGSSLYALIHFSRKIFLFQDKEKDRYSPMMNGFVAVFLYYQYGIKPSENFN